MSIKIWHVAAIMAVLGGGILLGKAVGRNEELWLKPVAPDTGEGWPAPKGTVELNPEVEAVASKTVVDPKLEATAAVAAAKYWFEEIVNGQPEQVDTDSAKCDNPRRIYEMVLFVAATAAPAAPAYPVPIGEQGSSKYFMAVPLMETATTEYVRTPSTYCSVMVQVGVLNEKTGAWESYPPMVEQELDYEIVATDSGKIRMHYIQDNGARFN